jgi:hypothetical protein
MNYNENKISYGKGWISINNFLHIKRIEFPYIKKKSILYSL